MGCVVDVVRGYSAVLNEDFQKGAWGIPTLWVKGGNRIKSKLGRKNCIILQMGSALRNRDGA